MSRAGSHLRTPLRTVLAATVLSVAATATALPPLTAAARGGYPDGGLGYDISFPQCGGAYPAAPYAYGIVGVNNGRAFVDNPCLQSEFHWASQAAVAPSVYVNTDYPHGSTADKGMDGPLGHCSATDQPCQAYNYGWNAAGESFTYAASQHVTASMWWLDVETANYWNNDLTLNARDIQGELDFFTSKNVTAGIYSILFMWRDIAGYDQLPTVPEWIPGPEAFQYAPKYCSPSKSFAGGPVVLVQYPNGNYDGNFSCGPPQGYWMAGADGGIFALGYAAYHGSAGNQHLNRPIVGMATTTDALGYWLVASDGGVFSFGDAQYQGSAGTLPLVHSVVGIAATPDGKGYWLAASDGGVFAFGDALFLGSLGGAKLNRPIVGIAATPTGHGYWLVASDGGVFSFGDALFAGSTGSIALNQPIVGLAGTHTGHGYWLVASDGGIFAFGDATFHGSTASIRLSRPVVGITTTPAGNGYWLVASDGGVFSFGDAFFYGGMGGQELGAPIVAIAGDMLPNGPVPHGRHASCDACGALALAGRSLISL